MLTPSGSKTPNEMLSKYGAPVSSVAQPAAPRHCEKAPTCRMTESASAGRLAETSSIPPVTHDGPVP